MSRIVRIVILVVAIVLILGLGFLIGVLVLGTASDEVAEVPREVLEACNAGLEAVVFEGETFQCDEVVTNDGPTEVVEVESEKSVVVVPADSDSEESFVAEAGCQPVYIYGRDPQPQIAHPSVYLETGVNQNTLCWTVLVREGFTLVVGGFTVDGTSGGVYKALPGPQTVTVQVTDGFIALPVNEVAEGEFCFRVGQAVQYGWAMNTVQPLSGWEPCGGVAAVPLPGMGDITQLPADCTRQTTGSNQMLAFEAGASVFGWSITLGDGRSCDGGDCYLVAAPTAGVVTSGVICPWETEVVGITPWTP